MIAARNALTRYRRHSASGVIIPADANTSPFATVAEDGLIDEVLRPLKSGKQAAQYQEERSVRNSRRARAMNKRTRYGWKEQEKA